MNKIKAILHNRVLYQLIQEEKPEYDYIIVMEERNKRDVLRIVGDDYEGKVHLLMEFTDTPCEIEDPWYTGNFDKVYQQISLGCHGLYQYLLEKEVRDGE